VIVIGNAFYVLCPLPCVPCTWRPDAPLSLAANLLGFVMLYVLNGELTAINVVIGD
jgi:hypothetical protein